MNIISYFESKNQRDLIDKIARCDWSAAQYLVRLLSCGTFHAKLGGEGDLFLLLDGDELVSFATLTRQESISDERLFPWIGFVYTTPKYRGWCYARRILVHVEAVAWQKGYSRVYLSTDMVGFFERYGYQYLYNRVGFWSTDQRVLYKDLDEIDP